MTSIPFPRFPDDWEQTRSALHSYSKALGAIPHATLPHHPKWWHISLTLKPNGLTIDNVGIPDGGILNGRIDFRTHEVVLEASDGWTKHFDMRAGRTGTEMAEGIIAAVESIGVSGEWVAKDYESDDATTYDEEAARTYGVAIASAERVFEAHRAEIGGNAGPVQFWPHGFDLAFEWFGTKTIDHEEHGRTHTSASQLNLGFYSAGEPYFYSNPWPFAGAELLDHPLPDGAQWITDSFEGSTLPYAAVADDPAGADRVADYAKRVYEIAQPTLMA